MPFLLSIYQRLTPFLAKGVLAYLHHRLKKGKEDPQRLKERLGEPSKQRPQGSVVWFHGASVGEAVSLLPLLHRLQDQFPHLTPLVTTGTVTAAKVLQKTLPKRCIHQYIPLDIPAWIQQFLDYWQPDIAVFVESEFWPNLILTCQARKIPLYLINAHLSEKSYQSWRRFPRLIRHLLSCFEACLAQSAMIAKRLKDLGADPSKVKACGNLKFAASPLPYKEQDLKQLQSMIKGRPLWVAASTHTGEEKILAEAHQMVKKTLPDVLTILIPRHPQRGEEIAEELIAQGLAVARRSCQDVVQPSTDIYLADTIGELGLFYRLSDIAFLGGTFVPIGGHNPIEAALLACALIWGPYTHKQTEICDILKPSASSVATAEELATEIEKLLTHSALRAAKIKKAQELLKTQEGVLDCVMEVLQKKLGKSGGSDGTRTRDLLRDRQAL